MSITINNICAGSNYCIFANYNFILYMDISTIYSTIITNTALSPLFIY